MSPIIKVEQLTKRYKQTETNAVDGISFTVEPGEFFALLGPNGAGKTTTISILTTTLAPTDGLAEVAGYDVFKQASEVRKRAGIIFQRPSLDRNLTAEENVRFHALLYGQYPYRPTYKTMPQAYKKKVADLSAVLGIEKEIYQPIKTLSGGMMRKLEIIRSLIHEPKVLFLDEPTAGLDAETRSSLWNYLDEVRQQSGTTIFLTTHYLEEAEQADSVCILNTGKVVSFGALDKIKSDLVEEYLLIDAEDRKVLRAELDRLNISHNNKNGQIQIGVRSREVHQLLKSIGTPLTSIKTHAPSLEDAYLEIIRRSEWN